MGWKKASQWNGHLKKAGVATPIANKIDFKSKLVKRDGDEGGKIVDGV